MEEKYEVDTDLLEAKIVRTKASLKSDSAKLTAIKKQTDLDSLYGRLYKLEK